LGNRLIQFGNQRFGRIGSDVTLFQLFCAIETILNYSNTFYVGVYCDVIVDGHWKF
jgi:hypothetical protein